MLKIKELELREIRMPLREPFRISSGEVRDRRILLLQLTDQDNVQAWGECVAGEFPNYSPETIDTAWLAIREWLAPLILRNDFASAADVWPALNANIRGHNMAKAALEMAAWALAAQRDGIALAQALGGRRDRLAVGISLGIQESPAALVEKAQAALQQGYRKIKIKIMPGADLSYVRAAREALGDGAPIMADANSAYTLDDLPILRKLDGFNLMMIEQPLARDDLLRHAKLQEQLNTSICLDESIAGVQQAEDMIALKSGRIINIKPGRVGGFLVSQQIHDLCRAHAIPVWCGGMLESGIGRAHNVALASLPNFVLPGDISPSRRYWENDIVTPEWTMDEEGFVTVPFDRPGAGVEVDLDRIENLTERLERRKK